KLAIPLPKPVNGYLQRSLRRVQFLSKCGVRRVGLPEKENLQVLEMIRAAVLNEFVPQSLHDSIEHQKRPTAFEDPLGCLVMSRLVLIALSAGREVKRHNHATAALVCAPAVFLVSHKEFQ